MNKNQVNLLYTYIYFFFYIVDYFKHTQKYKRQYTEFSCTDYRYSRINNMLYFLCQIVTLSSTFQMV